MTSLVTGLTFLVISVTGVLLFFHIKSGVIIHLHEWIGMVFLAAAVVHLVINWRSFIAYLSNRSFWVSFLAVAAACALVMTLPSGHGKGPRGGSPTVVGQAVTQPQTR